MNEVERIFNELQGIEAALQKTAGLSDLEAFRNASSKAMLLAAASYFERCTHDTILDLFKGQTTADYLLEFVKNQALERKFHLLFDWSSCNANKFFALFGPEFSRWISGRIKDDDSRDQQIRDFISINSNRNQLVHNNYATFLVDMTYEEIWHQFQSGLNFIEWLPSQFHEFSTSQRQSGGESA